MSRPNKLIASSLSAEPGYITLGPVTDVRREQHTLTLSAGPAALRLTFLDDGIVRVRLAPTGSFAPLFSYGLAPETDWPGPSHFQAEDSDDQLAIRTAALEVRIERSPCRLAFYTLGGQLLQRDADGPAWGDPVSDNPRVACSKVIQPRERFYGLGDKPRRLNLRGARLRNWNTDAFYYQRDTDPLYKTFPFLLGLRNGRAYGLFFDNTYRHTFDLGTPDGQTDGQTEVAPDHDAETSTASGMASETLVYEAEGGELCYYFIHADEPIDVTRKFTRLTGPMPMLPKWSLGYHQCRYSYFPESDIKAVAEQFRNRHIPCDVIYFDIHYMDGYRVFTWNRDGFPEPERLIRELRADGFRSIVIIDPGVKVDDDYAIARQGLERDAFCRTPDGEVFVGDVWPGPSYFPDFTRPDVRTWWGDLFKEFVDMDIPGIWCDMNEPAVFDGTGAAGETRTMPTDIRHDYDGHPTDHLQAHNVYGMQMVRAVYQGLRRLQPERRPFVITRAAYAGTQRYAVTWTGDNTSAWDHLRLSIEQCLSLNICGMSFAGSDVGGFCGTPDGEMMARWTQLGAFTPLFRNHSAVDVPRQEVWLFGDEVERICKRYIELRYQLLPYFYTVLQQAAAEAMPMMRPLALMHPTDETVLCDEPVAFYHGDSLLVHPVVEAGQETRPVYLPAGQWFDFWTGEKHRGPTTLEVATPLEHMPIYVKAGSVVPMQPVMQYSDEKPVETLTLHVYPPARSTAGESFESVLYEDAGDTWNFETGEAYRCTFSGQVEGDKLEIATHVDGSFVPTWTAWAVTVHGVSAPPAAVVAGARPIPFTHEGQTLRFTIEPSSGFTVTW